MNHPVLTIVTVTFNAGELLRKTLQSVKKGFPPHAPIEYLIIDGKSTDNTLQIAGEYQSQLSLNILSESDKGLYDAMNKGLELAQGEYIWFLNAGDEVHDDTTITRLLASFRSGADIYYSDALFMTAEGVPIGLRSQVTPHRLPKNIQWQDMAMGMKICHQAFIARKKVAPRFEINNLSADLDWEIQAMKNAEQIEYLDFVLCRYLLGGLSTQKHQKSLTDRWKVLKRHFGWQEAAFNHLKIALRGALFYWRRGKYW